MRILGVSGSLQAASANLELLRTIGESLPVGDEWVLSDHIRHLPLFDPDIEALGSTPEAVGAWRAALAGSDAVVIASPEYGHSLPGALKNGIDWVIGTGELNRKVVAVTASTNAPGRGQRGLDALVRTLRAVDATVVGGAPIVRGEGDTAQVRALVDELVKAAG